jgi:LPS export ABC transporter protein LptC
VLRNVEMRQTSPEGLLWILRADVAVSRADEEPLELTGLTVLFHDGDERVRSTLTSKRGEADPKRSRLVASDSVVVITAEGERLETEYLEWDPDKEKVRTPEPFRLTRAQDVVTGVGIESDPDLKQYVVRSQLRVEVRDENAMEGLDR